MRILTDTHIFIWSFQEPERLFKLDINKFELDRPLSEIIELERRVNNIQILPIEPRHIYALSDLPMHHRDPFDRLLIAQSNSEKMPLLSADAVFDRYQVQILR